MHSPATVHGFAGYFEAKLYKDVHFSIVPQTFSTGTHTRLPLPPSGPRLLASRVCRGFTPVPGLRQGGSRLSDAACLLCPLVCYAGMFSWFPMYIPLRQPLYVKAGDTIDVHVWRNVSPRKVGPST